MPILRLTQYAESQPDCYRVEIALEGDGPRQTAQVSFGYQLAEQDRENIRWYLEDYLQNPSDPAPQIAARVEQRMAAIGIELFQNIFQGNDDARDLWATLRQDLNNTRVEVLTGIDQAATIPWELIRDPRTDTPLALRAPAFVRIHSQAAQRPRLPQTDGETIRILLVICRPKGRFDVPFRSVASRILKGLGNQPDSFQLDVLRPPTFEALSRKLRQAKVEGKPYHVVHFDGHGVYDINNQVTLQNKPLIFQDHRPGMHGYLAFENSANEDNVEFVNGPELGRLLVETDVPVLVLNACRSAYAEAQSSPTQVDKKTEHTNDLHAQVRALGSLAQEIIDAGVAGIVAMRYEVYVMTAAQFVTDLYASLVQGQTLGEAVTLGRKQLNAQPQREIAFKPIALQDWSVPIVYEAGPIALFPKPVQANELKITLHANDALPSLGWLDPQLPKAPDTGFFGRDETLLAIDRAFDQHSIVLLHAFAGSGKTSTAAEFGRWYSLTGGVEGPVLFTSFERYLPLPKVLDKLGQVFRQDLERSSIHWLTLDNDQRREVALKILSQIPVIWIWDNVEPVAGFSDGEARRWSSDEQQELVNFLREAKQTKAKVLITSRRDERNWLGDLPVKIQVPPMPMVERVNFTKAIADNYRHKITEILDWIPLLKYSQGNPLTLRIVASQALRNNYNTCDSIEEFVINLRHGEAEFESEEAEDRSNSLWASLSYGFKHSFSEQERKIISSLAFFQEIVSIHVFSTLGFPENNWKIPDPSHVKKIHKEANLLLRKASEIGFLQFIDRGFYWIHPALPWFFSNSILKYFSNAENQLQLAHSFVKAVGVWGIQYHNMYFDGDRAVVAALLIEEANFLHALKLAEDNHWLQEIHNVSRGLFTIYHHLGYKHQEIELIKEIYPFFTLPQTAEPVPGLEKEWDCISHHYLEFLIRNQKPSEANEVARRKFEWNQKNAADALNVPVNLLSESQKIDIRNLAVSAEGLAQVCRHSNIEESIEYCEKAISLYRKLKNNTAEAVVAFSIAQAYESVDDFQSFTKAQEYLACSLQLFDEDDFLGKARSTILFAQICLKRVEKGIELGGENGLNEDGIIKEVRLAIALYKKALDILPFNAYSDIGETLLGLGRAYNYFGEFNLSLNYCRQAIQLFEESGNYPRVVESQSMAAISLARHGRYFDALAYAKSALSTSKSHCLSRYFEYAEELINKIMQKIQSEG